MSPEEMDRGKPEVSTQDAHLGQTRFKFPLYTAKVGLEREMEKKADNIIGVIESLLLYILSSILWIKKGIRLILYKYDKDYIIGLPSTGRTKTYLSQISPLFLSSSNIK